MDMPARIVTKPIGLHWDADGMPDFRQDEADQPRPTAPDTGNPP